MSASTPPNQAVVVAGASGDLGGRITAALVARGADVRALVRAGGTPDAPQRLAEAGATVVEVDFGDAEAVTEAVTGAACVVSALSGLRPVIVDRQTVLLDAAVRAGVPRFVPSDFSADYTRTRPGHNRNFDLRREFAERADRAPIAVTSIFCGAFMDMLGGEMPMVQPRLRAVLYWGDRDQPLDFTTRADVAAYTAAAALDDSAPRVLRISGETASAREIAATMTRVTGRTYRTLWAGGTGALASLIPLVRRLAPDKPDPVFPAWQGMAYTYDMFTGGAQLRTVDNERYADVRWTPLRDRLTEANAAGA